MFPPTERRCHRTGFEQSCRELVTSGKCGRWGDLAFEDPKTGIQKTEYHCLDDMAVVLLLKLGQMQAQTAASVDKVTTEVAAGAKKQADAASEVVASNARLGHDMRGAMAAAMEIAVMQAAALAPPPAPKMIEATQ